MLYAAAYPLSKYSEPDLQSAIKAAAKIWARNAASLKKRKMKTAQATVKIAERRSGSAELCAIFRPILDKGLAAP